MILARVVATDSFGIIVAVLAFATIPQVFFDFGLSTFVIRERSVSAKSWRIRSSLHIGTWSSIIFCLIGVIVLALLGYYSNSLFFLLIPLAIWMAGEKNSDLWMGVLISDGAAWINGVVLVSRRFLCLTCFVTLGALGLDWVLSYSLGMAAGAMLSSIASYYIVRGRIIQSSQGVWSEILRESRHFWLNSVSAQIKNLDNAIVGIVAGPAASGIYGLASRLINPLRLVPDTVSFLLMPEVSKNGIGVLAKFSRILGISLGLLILLFGALIFAVPFFVPILVGHEYDQSIICIQILLVGMIFTSMSSFANAILLGLGVANVAGRVAFIGGILCILGALAGSLIAGAVGATIFVSLVSALQFCVLAILVSRLFKASKTGPGL